MSVATWYAHILQQMAAESYLEGTDLSNTALVKVQLESGNNRDGFPERGLTAFASRQANEFQSKYTIRHQWSDNATTSGSRPAAPGDIGYLALNGQQILANSGLSATLIQDKETSAYTVSIRSTEFLNWAEGGDGERDRSGADISIFQKGFALAQIDALERYYEWLHTPGSSTDGGPLLPVGTPITVTGYSLGGHLATAFTMMHPEVVHAYTFNGAGIGDWNTARGSLQDMLAYYRNVLADADAAGWAPESADAMFGVYTSAKAASGPLNAHSVYSDARYQWAIDATQRRFETSFSLTANAARTNLGGAENRITAVYGHATHNDKEWVANSGRHGLAEAVFIEGQPGVEGWGGVGGLPGDFGNTHSIVLIADSLALMRLFQKADATITQGQIQAIFAASSNQRSSVLGPSAKVEADSLERALDALRRVVGASDLAQFPATLPNGAQRGFGDSTAREGFYDRIATLTEEISAGSYTFRPLIGIRYGHAENGSAITTAATDLLDLAEGAQRAGDEGRAYRYALKEGNPFVVLTGVMYATGSRLNPNGELEIYDAQNARDGMTTQYLADRVALIERYLHVAVDNDIADGADYSGRSGPNGAPLAWQGQTTYYEDRRKDFKLGQAGQFNTSSRIIFGTDAVDIVDGGSLEDHLYGHGSADVLTGKRGGDYLEGGSGLDTYRFSSGDGADTVLDADGKGQLVWDGEVLTIGIKDASADVWRFGDKVMYARAGDSLLVTFSGQSGDSITIDDFDFEAARAGGYLGIRLIDAQAFAQGDQTPTHEFQGDRWALGSYVDEDGVWNSPDEPALDSFGNYLRDPQLEQPGLQDEFHGSPDDDAMFGGGNVDVLMGEAGDDLLHGNEGDDVLIGGGGDDVLYGDEGNDDLNGGNGQDLVFGGDGADLLYGGDGDDVLVGNGAIGIPPFSDATEDRLYGGEGNDQLFAGERQSVDEAIAFGGAVPEGSPGATLYGEGGDDLLVGSNQADELFGGDGADLVLGGEGDDALYGEGGDDYLAGGSGVDELFGDEGNDVLVGGNGDDLLRGGAGDDLIEAGGGDDVVLISGNDVVWAGDGNDDVQGFEDGPLSSWTVFLEAGDDGIEGSEGDDFIDGGEGADFIYGNGGNDLLLGAEGDDVLEGGAGNNTLMGGEGADSLYAGDGADLLMGGTGDDIVDGGAGDDRVTGGAGDDLLYDGDGADTFEFMPGDGADVVVASAMPGEDTLSFGYGIAPEDVAVLISPESTLLSITGTEDRVVLMHGEDGKPGIERITFADGRAWDGRALVTSVSGQPGDSEVSTSSSGSEKPPLVEGSNDGSSDGSAPAPVDDVIARVESMLTTRLESVANGGTALPGLVTNDLQVDTADGFNSPLATQLASSPSGGGRSITNPAIVLPKGDADSPTVIDLDDAGALLDWYAGSGEVAIPAFVREADFDDSSVSPSRERVVQSVDAPVLTSWELTNALLQYHLAIADAASLGSEPAYGFGRNDSLAGIGLNAAQELIGASGFAAEAQALRAFSGLNEGFAALA